MAQQQSKQSPTEEQIRARAYELFLARGETPGSQEDDWLQAETELSKEGAPSVTSSTTKKIEATAIAAPSETGKESVKGGKASEQAAKTGAQGPSRAGQGGASSQAANQRRSH